MKLIEKDYTTCPLQLPQPEQNLFSLFGKKYVARNDSDFPKVISKATGFILKSIHVQRWVSTILILSIAVD